MVDPLPIDRWPTWTEEAACAQPGTNPALWHSDDPDDQTQAKLICTTCPVQPECLRDYGRDPHGIIGGLGPEERARHYARPVLDARPAHGTRSRYMGSTRWPKCSDGPNGQPCDACKQAHAAHEHEARARRKAQARAAAQ